MKTPSTLFLAAALLTLGSTAGLHGQITTYVSPSSQAYDEFGYSVTAVGTNRVLIGDPYADTGAANSGAAYLFDLAGNLITAYTNPTPSVDDNFGNSAAAVGTNRVLIGANHDAAYLYDLEGNRVATCYNPTPETYSGFGNVVAAVGTNRLLITARNDSSILTGMGLAYLFDLAGNLMTTYTNPTPAAFDSFGWSATGVGNDRVLIGASRDDAGAENAGAAYLFDLAGHLIATYTNPAPAVGARFGSSIGAVGSDRVLIGTPYDNTGATAAGAAYLFSTNGTLLMTFTNPTPAANDFFGYSVAAVGSDLVLIGASNDSTAAQSAGAAYLFSANPPAPAINIVASGPGQATISWSPATPDWVLQETLSLSPAVWTNSSSGATNPVVVPATLTRKFYRLHKP